MIKSMKKRIACGALAIVALILPFCGSEPAPESAYSRLFPIIQNDKYGYINKTGQIVINPQFGYVFGFSEGLAPVRIGNESGSKWGYIDKSGMYVINPQFDGISRPFSHGLAMVDIGNTWGYIDKSGKYVWTPQD